MPLGSMNQTDVALASHYHVSNALIQVLNYDTLLTIWHGISSFVQTNPLSLGIAIAGVGVSILSGTLLPFLGFATLGPGPLSIAAAWQASIGNVVAGSLFSFLQSAGMGGAGAGIFTAMGMAGSLIAAGALAVGVLDKLPANHKSLEKKLQDIGSHVWNTGIQAIEKAKGDEFVKKTSHQAKDMFDNAAADAQRIGADVANKTKAIGDNVGKGFGAKAATAKALFDAWMKENMS